MDITFNVVAVLTTVLCSLVAGFLFAFAVVVMPGIRRLDDGGFIRAFQVIDGVIQRGQPLFIVVWVGSAASIVIAAAMAFWTLSGVDRLLLAWAAVLYIAGVQAPTVVINLPLNGELQRLDVDAIQPSARAEARARFESRWNRSNNFRTVCAIAVAIALAILLLRV
jgi:uncharacterized membrane protein